jgi:hypothetical protein
MLATNTTNKALALDAHFRCGISQSPHLKTSRPRSDTKCNDLAQHAVYCPLWASQSTHFQGFYPGPPHGFVLGSHAWPQNAYNMLATNTTNALALDARSDVGYHNPPILKRVVLDSDTKCNSLTQQAVYCPL